jgi:hypothetical protein
MRLWKALIRSVPRRAIRNNSRQLLVFTTSDTELAGGRVVHANEVEEKQGRNRKPLGKAGDEMRPRGEQGPKQALDDPKPSACMGMQRRSELSASCSMRASQVRLPGLLTPEIRLDLPLGHCTLHNSRGRSIPSFIDAKRAQAMLSRRGGGGQSNACVLLGAPDLLAKRFVNSDRCRSGCW